MGGGVSGCGTVGVGLIVRGRPVAMQGVPEGVRCTTPNLPKGPLFVTKWAKNGVFVGGFTIGGEVK